MTNDATAAHAQARAYVQARLDDRLAPEHAAWLDAHLAACEACRAYAGEHQRLAALLPAAFQARWDRPARPARRAAPAAGQRPNHGAYLPIGGPSMLARQKRLNLAGVTLGLGALVVLLIGVAFALQTTTLTDSQIPGQAESPTALPALFEPVPMMWSLNVPFGDSLALEGYSVIPNETGVTVQLLWHALSVPTADYAVGVFAMPDGAQSAIVAQSDSVPVAGTRPTTSWQAGEYLVDSHDLPMTVETDLANLVLWVNVYDPSTGERLTSDPAGSGPFNATPIGSFSVPAEPPLTSTPLPVTGEVPMACADQACTPTPTPCQEGCEGDWATGTAAALTGATGTPCLDGCFLYPSAQATADMAATLGWTATPIGFIPSVTPCQSGCPKSFAYTVRAGDTLEGIAAFYGVTTAEIIALNSLTEPVTLAVGQVLTIPVAQAPVPLEVTPTPTPSP